MVALYDSCLPEITPEVLYPTVCGKWAKTLILLRDFEGKHTVLSDSYSLVRFREHLGDVDKNDSLKQLQANSTFLTTPPMT